MSTASGPEEIIARVKAAQARTGDSLRKIAAEAGLSSNGLVRLTDRSWRPRSDTLTKLEHWLDTGAPTPTIMDIPLVGTDYELIHEPDGWYYVRDDICHGPYVRIRDAEAAAKVVKRPRGRPRKVAA